MKTKQMSPKQIQTELSRIGFSEYDVFLRVGGVSLMQVKNTINGKSNNPSILMRLEELGVKHGRNFPVKSESKQKQVFGKGKKNAA
ncbi:hypothetical protein ND864_17605 [Leptospira levettii]|uniref:hypothetical protein n=1 Tax=Leptospira levettii TaxID=2023178 RepID=UPI00223CFD2E|nr:hypothetical protein [Leptospira levettii]MCW7467540.1 hypothetical protein [Leptospira levettii]